MEIVIQIVLIVIITYFNSKLLLNYIIIFFEIRKYEGTEYSLIQQQEHFEFLDHLTQQNWSYAFKAGSFIALLITATIIL